MKAGLAIAALASAATAGCHAFSAGPRGAHGAVAVGPGASRPYVSSNILRGDYAGSESCRSCHADVYAAWQSSPMHLMTRNADDPSVRIRAPFAQASFHFKDDVARLTERDGARYIALSSAGEPDRLFRVTRVIGGRYREDFAGVEVSPRLSPSPARRAAELLLPISYVFEDASFRVKGYSVLVGERPGLRAGGVWSATCVFCHNTVPYFDATWGALAGPGAPTYQGELVDRLLPADRRWRLAVSRDGEPALREAVRAELEVVAGAAPETDPDAGPDLKTTLEQGIRVLRARFGPQHFSEVGIGCEACHGGSREHVASPRRLPDFLPHSAFLAATPESPAAGDVSRAEAINRTCARCHQVLFSRYPFTWEGGRRRGGDPGGSSITSGEARDFLLGGCARQMSCVACHDPHAEDRRAELDRLATPAGNGVCVRCHIQYSAPGALAAHAHHEPSGAGASCVGCHMPRKNMGLGYALTRYHRIGLPDDRGRVERDRPIECALCHPDKSVGALVGAMEGWWGKRYDRGRLLDLYGSLEARPLEATLVRGKAHEQAVALAVLGQSGQAASTPGVARQLLSPFPLVRYYARKALGQMLAREGRSCEIDLDRPASEIAAAGRRCLPEAFTNVMRPLGDEPSPRAEPDED